jgi:LPS export ABC transporter protein LptC
LAKDLSRLRVKKLSIFLLLVILIAIGTIVAIFIGYRQVSDAPESLLSSIKDGADLSLGKIRQTATREGRKEWSLEAGSADYIENEKKAVLKKIFITYYLEDNREVYLEADQGILNTATNDIEFSGNVVVRNENYRLKTDRLDYRHNERLIFSNEPVHISGSDAEITANSLKYDLKNNQIFLNGNVSTLISRNFMSLGWADNH